MDLILWRHAEAEEGFPDQDRKLTDLGKKQAEIKIRCVNCRLCWEGPHNIAFLEQ